MLKYQHSKTSDISIVLLLYNTPYQKLKNLINYKNFDIYILDQSNDQATKDRIEKILPNIKYYKVSDHNKGFAKGINFLSKKIKTKFFLCTQIDVLIKKDSIVKLKEPFFKNRNCILSIPNINKSSKKVKKKNNIVIANNFIGAIFLADKKKFNKIGRFDENFFFYWEDMDLSQRISNKKNFSIYRCNNVFAKHKNGSSTLDSKKSTLIRLTNFKFGEYYFQYKYNKLKTIKIIREPIVGLIMLVYYLTIFQKVNFYKTFYNIIGIFKFYKFLLNKK